MLWTKYTIRVRGFLAIGSSAFPLLNTGPTSAVTLAAVKAALEVPRRALLYNIGPTAIVSVPIPPDAKLGPHPLPAIVTQPNTGAFLVECGCVVRLVDCPTDCPPPGYRSPVVSLRWTQTETFDQNWYSKLVTSGKLIVRSDLRTAADFYRPFCTPALLNDYQRLSSKYTLSPDGLELDFMFEDQEFDRLPPYGCTKASGTYTVVSERPGVTRVGSVKLALEGPKGADRKILLLRALQIGYSKLRADGYLTLIEGSTKETPPIIWLTVTEDLFTPRVEITMSALMTMITKNGLSKARDRVVIAQEKVRVLKRNLAIAVVAGASASFTIPGLGLLLGAAAVGGIAAALNAALSELDEARAALPAAAAADVADIAAAAAGVVKAPAIMPSVGLPTYGLGGPQPGIATPTRGRLAALLVAAFRDPCLCFQPETEVNLITTGSPPSFLSNPGMTPPVLPGTATQIGVPSAPQIGTPGVTPGSVPMASIWDGVPTAPQVGTPYSQNGYGTAAQAAEITVGPTNPRAGLLEQTSAVIDEAPYDSYHLEKQLEFDTGRVQLPGTGVGSAGGVSKIVTASGGRAREITTWVASRAGKPPILPPAESEDPNLVLLYGNVVARDVQMTADGAEPSYMVAGYYVRAVLNPALYELSPGVAPYLSQQVENAALVALQYWQAPAEDTTTADQSSAFGGSNPFVEGGVTLDEVPVQAPGFPNGATGANANYTSSSYYQPPDNP